MNYLKIITDNSTPSIIIEPEKPRSTVILLHGYGGSKEEMLPLAYRLALAGFAGLAIDLPGHGQNKELFNYENAIKLLGEVVGGPYDPAAIIGHSISARLGLTLGLPIIMLSPPLTIDFDGSRSEMLKVLRARRVREEKPYWGLRTILEKLAGKYDSDTTSLTIYGGNDLKTVKDFAQKRRGQGYKVMMVKGAGHLDIISAEETLRAVPEWIIKNVKKI